MIARLVFTYQTANTDIFPLQGIVNVQVLLLLKEHIRCLSCLKIITKVVPGTSSFS